MKKLFKTPLKITNFTKNPIFFVVIQNYKYFIELESSKTNLLPKPQELIRLKKEIENYQNKINSVQTHEKIKKITILDNHRNSLKNYFKPTEAVHIIYANYIKEIINILKQKETNIYLKNIQIIY